MLFFLCTFFQHFIRSRRKCVKNRWTSGSQVAFPEAQAQGLLLIFIGEQKYVAFVVDFLKLTLLFPLHLFSKFYQEPWKKAPGGEQRYVAFVVKLFFPLHILSGATGSNGPPFQKSGKVALKKGKKARGQERYVTLSSCSFFLCTSSPIFIGPTAKQVGCCFWCCFYCHLRFLVFLCAPFSTNWIVASLLFSSALFFSAALQMLVVVFGVVSFWPESKMYVSGKQK